MSNYETPFVLMGVGIQGAGKSTLLRPYSESLGVRYLNTDEIRQDLTGDAGDQTVNAEAWDTLYARAEESLEQGESVVVDALHTDERYRRVAVEKYRKFGAKTIIAFVFEVSPEVAKARVKVRNNEVSEARRIEDYMIDKSLWQLRKAPPSLSEGFDDIIVTNNDA